MDFLLQLKFLYENHTYFGNNGLLNLMQSTDILTHTPLDVYRDDFDVSTEENYVEMLGFQMTTKNMLMVRHLRSFLNRGNVKVI